jgi:hypothetical protein
MEKMKTTLSMLLLIIKVNVQNITRLMNELRVIFSIFSKDKDEL